MSFTIRLRSLVWFLTGLVLALVLAVLFRAWRADAVAETESSFVPITPCRLFDLRPAPDTVGERSTPLGPAESHPVQVTGGTGNCTGIPTDATGVAMNVTIVAPTAPSYLSVVPGDVTGDPGVSSLNYLPGAAPTPNKVDVGLDDRGQIRVFNRYGAVYVLADVVGYYTDHTLADFEARIADLETSDTDAGLAARVTELEQTTTDLEAANDALAADVAELTAANSALAADIAELTAADSALAADVAALQAKTASMSLETVDDEPVVRFTGVNVQVVSGSGETSGPVNGTGNLIVGYHENFDDLRSGSHNLVVGPYHSYTSYGSFIAGHNSTALGAHSSVSGGADNAAYGLGSSVSGGSDNVASVAYSSVSGGLENTAGGTHSSVSGGAYNWASGDLSTVSGGLENTSGGHFSSVSGGHSRSVSGDYDWRAGDLFRDD